MLNNFEIFNENCIDTLNRMEDDTVDLVITSPPYNMNLRIRNENTVQDKLILQQKNSQQNIKVLMIICL